jgi:hypothetical protein
MGKDCIEEAYLKSECLKILLGKPEEKRELGASPD